MSNKSIEYNDKLFRLCYRKIFRILRSKIGRGDAKIAMDQIKRDYKNVLSQFPDVGKNTLTDMAYLGAMFISIWHGTGQKFTVEELDQIYADILKSFRWMFGLANLNRKFVKKKLRHEITTYTEWLNKEGALYPGKWEAHQDDSVKKGVRFIFTKCPVRDYCAAHDCLTILPAICHQDHLMCKMMHGTLKRESTLAAGDCCDFWMMGDKE